MKGVAKYRHLILPASLPSFISGLKQGWAFSWRSLMAGELLVIVPGALSIGVRMQQARDLSDSSLVICYIIVVLVIGILIDVLFNIADNDLSVDDVEHVLASFQSKEISRSTGNPCVFGYTPDGRFIIVVFEEIDDHTIYPITAYRVAAPKK